jgi:hypothetical protein
MIDKSIKEFKTREGIVRIKELEDNKNFKKGDLTLLPIGFGFKIEELKEDEKGLYLMDGDSKRYVYHSTYNKWDNSLIKEYGFRIIELIN